LATTKTPASHRYPNPISATKSPRLVMLHKPRKIQKNIPIFLHFFFFPPARRYSLCVFLGIIVNGTRFKLSLFFFNTVSLSFSVYLTSFSSLQIDAHEQVLSVSISLI
jgi:hypothetical protein